MILYQVRFERSIAMSIVSVERCRRLFYLSILLCNITVFSKRITKSLVYGKWKLSDQRYVGFKYTMLASEEYLKLDLEDTDEDEGFLKKILFNQL